LLHVTADLVSALLNLRETQHANWVAWKC